MKHVMLDLETMGTEPGAPVVAIGACRFEMNDASIIADCFYQEISLQPCMDSGLKPSASTISWWLADESVTPVARAIFNQGRGIHLFPALFGFNNWFNQEPCELWCNSAAFDCGCYRTVKNLQKAIDVKLESFGTHHNALDDAISQAHHLRAIWKTLGLS